MFTIRRTAGAIVLASWCVSVAATPTGNELADRCDQSVAYCIGYISGVIDAEEFGIVGRIRVGQLTPAEVKLIEISRKLAREQLKNIDQLMPFQVRLIGRALAEHGLDQNEPKSISPLKACLPHYATRQQLTDVVTKHLRDNPATRHLPAQMLVVDALAVAFPCY